MEHQEQESPKSIVYAELDRTLIIRAEDILATLGISQAAAITHFYRQIVLRRGIPFELTLPKRQNGGPNRPR